MISVTDLGLPAMSLMTWILALLPIVVILVLMLALNVSGGRSGIISWVLTAAIIYFVFGGGIDVIAAGTVKGLWSTLFVLFIIWSAMYMYNLVNICGAFEVIAAKFTEMTNGNKILQILILGWCFPTFVQGVCGFGVPVAVATPLLIGLGFDPLVSCITTLLGHSWGVTFGSLGSSYSILVSQSPVDTLYPGLTAFWGSIFIAFGGLIVGFCILHNYGARSMKNVGKAFKEGTLAVAFLSAVMGIAMIATCMVSPYVGCFVAGAAGLIAGVLVLPRLPMYKPAEGAEVGESTSWEKFFKNFSAYLILIVVVFAVYLIAPVKSALEADIFKIGLAFPENALAANEMGIQFVNDATKKYSALKIFTTPGTLIVVSSLLAAVCYKSFGLLPKGALGESMNRTIKQSIGATTTIIPMTMMAILMTEGGLTQYIAYGLAAVAGDFYPILAPFIGILGGFVTSSGTSSNILFTGLQYSAAEVLNISPAIILSQQTTGSSLSNSFSPGNCALGTGVSNQVGREGEILAATGVYNMIQGALVGILGYVLISMGLGL
ncbi:MAG: L-lactate permease [Erysipelotrichales bacterium]|nr:L-lactate permease [Erysipelotrichales bacterium]